MIEGTGDADPLLVILGGKARSQAVSTAADLAIADQLSGGPLALLELARRTCCDARRLRVLLRMLVGLELLTQPSEDVFELTDMGRRLRSDDLGPLATFVGSREQWDPWSRLRDSLQSGTPAFELANGRGLYEYMAANDDAAERYDAAIESFTRHEARALCASYDFGAAERVVDVGGGRGSLLAELLARWPDLHGTLFDLPHVVERALPELTRRFGDRVASASGNFLKSVPPGADHYVVKHVLHNWSDDEAVRILRNCAAAMAPNGRIVLIEAVLAPDCRPDTASLLDLEMLVLTGGRQRRKPELRRICQSAGLRIERMESLVPGAWLTLLASV